jgi:hypothetical protein
MVTRVDYRYLPDMIRVVRHLRAKLKAGAALATADIEEVVAKLGLLLFLDSDDQTLMPLADSFLTNLLAPLDTGNEPGTLHRTDPGLRP